MEGIYSVPLHRRAHERFKVDASATLMINEELRKPSILKDLSSRGAGVVSDCALEMDKKIEVVIRVPFFLDRPVHRKAKVVWCNKIGQSLWQTGLDFGLDNQIKLG